MRWQVMIATLAATGVLLLAPMPMLSVFCGATSVSGCQMASSSPLAHNQTLDAPRAAEAVKMVSETPSYNFEAQRVYVSAYLSHRSPSLPFFQINAPASCQCPSPHMPARKHVHSRLSHRTVAYAVSTAALATDRPKKTPATCRRGRINLSHQCSSKGARKWRKLPCLAG